MSRAMPWLVAVLSLYLALAVAGLSQVQSQPHFAAMPNTYATPTAAELSLDQYRAYLSQQEQLRQHALAQQAAPFQSNSASILMMQLPAGYVAAAGVMPPISNGAVLPVASSVATPVTSLPVATPALTQPAAASIAATPVLPTQPIATPAVAAPAVAAPADALAAASADLGFSAQNICDDIGSNQFKCAQMSTCQWDSNDSRCEPLGGRGECGKFNRFICNAQARCQWDSNDGRCELIH